MRTTPEKADISSGRRSLEKAHTSSTETIPAVDRRSQTDQRFACPHCDINSIFTASRWLQVHLFYTHKTKCSHSCFTCKKAFLKTKDFTDHLDKCSNKGPSRKDCIVIKESNDRENLERYLLRDTSEEQYKCPQSGTNFHDLDDISSDASEEQFKSAHNSKKVQDLDDHTGHASGDQFESSYSVKHSHGLDGGNGEDHFESPHSGKNVHDLDLDDHTGHTSEGHVESQDSCKNSHVLTSHSSGELPESKNSDKNSDNLEDLEKLILEKPCICLLCAQSFTNLEDFSKHWCPKGDQKRHICPQCRKGFNTITNLKNHLHVHSGPMPHVCPHCNQRFCELPELEAHIHVHINPKPLNITCPKCSQRTHFDFLANSSEGRAGLSDITNNASHAHSSSSPRTKENGYQQNCAHCNESFELDPQFLIPLPSMRNDRNAESDGDMCPHCSKRFTKVGLNNHMFSHTGDWPHTCSECGMGASSSSRLAVHKRTHTGERRFTCSTCKQSFSMKSTLQTHRCTLLSQHYHFCPTCNKRFMEFQNLKKHMETHTTEATTSQKPPASRDSSQTCLKCNKTFSSPHSLKQHLKIHNEVIEKPDKSAPSSKKSVQSYTHTNEATKARKPPDSSSQTSQTCVICDKRFSSPGNLKRHLKIHNKIREKPRKKRASNKSSQTCPTCYKTFHSPYSLKQHLKTHNEVIEKTKTPNPPSKSVHEYPNRRRNFPRSCNLKKQLEIHT